MPDEIKKAEAAPGPTFRMTTIRKAEKPDPKAPGNQMAVQGNAFDPEDEYQQYYGSQLGMNTLIEPPYNLRVLERLSQENNALQPCIEAMVTNIEGTGYDFEGVEEQADDDKDDTDSEQLKEFFAQPWPGVSFTTMRQDVRRDVERTGNSYFEVIRNPQDEVVFIRRVDAKMIRLVKLDDAVDVPVTLNRAGKEVTIKIKTRERRFAQMVNGVTLVYFKEFGASRDLHKRTAKWADPNQRLPAQDRATELIHFTCLPDAHTGYGVPRWINQLPSILGSRKAEEFNLDFFDNGGVPPALVLLQGGSLQPETRRALEQKFSGSAAKNNRIQVLEVEPSGGSLDTVATARVTVERFGAEKQGDSMFEGYDEKCEIRVRRAFRLPPIFVGQAADYSFATAFASYVVAEAQVFKPERDEFDEIITLKLLPAMGYPDHKMRSKPLVIEDATLKLQGIEVIGAMGDQVEPADIIAAVNDIVGLHLKVSDVAPTLADKAAQAQQQAEQQQQAALSEHQPLPPGVTHTMDGMGNVKAIKPVPIGQRGQTGEKGLGANGNVPKNKTIKKPPVIGAGSGTAKAMQKDESAINCTQFALDTMTAMRKRDIETLGRNLAIINGLDPASRAIFDGTCNELMFIDSTLDPEGLAELSCATMQAMGSVQ